MPIVRQTAIGYSINPDLFIDSKIPAYWSDKKEIMNSVHPTVVILLLIKEAAEQHIKACNAYKADKKKNLFHRGKGIFKHEHGSIGIKHSTELLKKIDTELNNLENTKEFPPNHNQEMIEKGIHLLQKLLSSPQGGLGEKSFKVILLTVIKKNFDYLLQNNDAIDIVSCDNYYKGKSATPAEVSQRLEARIINLEEVITKLETKIKPALKGYALEIEHIFFKENEDHDEVVELGIAEDGSLAIPTPY